jgi:ribosomal protein L7/L12/sugar lactone lactonase YvrE
MCAAPLPFDGTAVTVRCPYCTNTVIVPDELRRQEPPTVPYHAAQGAGLGDAIEQALRFAEVATLVRGGNKIQAIKLYRELTGTGLAEAKDAVERLERGEPLALQQTSFGLAAPVAADQHSAAIGEVKRLLREYNKIAAIKVFREAFGVGLKEAKDAVEDIETGRPIAFAQTGSGPQLLRPAATTAQIQPAATIKTGQGCGARVVIIVLISFFIVFGLLVKYLVWPQGFNAPTVNKVAPGFASEVMSFGSAGVGAGQFQDARAIAVDPQGRIFVAEYQGGRVQQFDSAGKFVGQWQSDPKSAILALAAGRDNVVYVVHPGKIVKFDVNTGERIGEVPNLNGTNREFYSSAYAALDGNLYAIGSNANIIRITRSGQVSTVVNVQQKAGEETDLEQLTMDGAGNFYALDSHSSTVLKFGTDGRLMTRFGGKGSGDPQLSIPSFLAVDNQGRVFVTDLGRGIRVFDAEGRWLAAMGPEHGLVFGLAFTGANELLACARNDHKVIKYRLNN